MVWRFSLLLVLLHVSCPHDANAERHIGKIERPAHHPSSTSHCERSLSKGDNPFRVLYLRGGANVKGNPKGPKAGLKPEEGDITVHLPSRCVASQCLASLRPLLILTGDFVGSKLPPPHHRCLKSALHRAKTDRWNGRYVPDPHNSNLLDLFICFRHAILQL